MQEPEKKRSPLDEVAADTPVLINDTSGRSSWANLSMRPEKIDMNSGEIRWQIPFGRMNFGQGIRTTPSWGAPNQGGLVITAGGHGGFETKLSDAIVAFSLPD